jgi:intracellular sulfur oxidation DsrE/DsrF family protein
MADSRDVSRPPFARRSFLARAGAATAAFGAAFGAQRAGGQTPAAAPAAAGARWQPTHHPQDDWYDQVPGKHRFFFDVTTTPGLVEAMQFVGNFYEANKSDYDLAPADLAVIVCLRHNAAPFGFNDAMWKKYGETLARRAEYVDQRNKDVTPAANPYTPVAAADAARVRGLAGLVRNGARFAICNISTQGIAGMIARAVDGKRDEIYKELAANLIPSARLVPAGILAVNRAQERGYSIT